MDEIVLLLNDMGGGGGVICVDTGDTAPTLRSQSKHHEPVVLLRTRGRGSIQPDSDRRGEQDNELN